MMNFKNFFLSESGGSPVAIFMEKMRHELQKNWKPGLYWNEGHDKLYYEYIAELSAIWFCGHAEDIWASIKREIENCGGFFRGNNQYSGNKISISYFPEKQDEKKYGVSIRGDSGKDFFTWEDVKQLIKLDKKRKSYADKINLPYAKFLQSMTVDSKFPPILDYAKLIAQREKQYQNVFMSYFHILNNQDNIQFMFYKYLENKFKYLVGNPKDASVLLLSMKLYRYFPEFIEEIIESGTENI